MGAGKGQTKQDVEQLGTTALLAAADTCSSQPAAVEAPTKQGQLRTTEEEEFTATQTEKHY